LIAVLALSQSRHRPALCTLVVAGVFYINVWFFRIVEDKKLSLSTNWKLVATAITLSFALCILVSFNLVSMSYTGVGQ